MQILVVKNYKELSRFAASLAIDQLNKKKSSVLGLATGNTMVGMYQELVRAFKAKNISFKRATTFNLDEFVGLPESHPGTLYSFMRKQLFDQVDLDPDRVNFLDSEALDPKKECRDYERALKKSGPIDLQFLGIGSNGHLAWDEPGTSLNSRTSVIELTLESRKAQVENFKNLRAVPRKGYSMGLATIREAKQLVLLASGQSKAAVVAEAILGPISKNDPASVIQMHPNVLVVLDREAASQLEIS